MKTATWESSNNRILLVDDDELYLETMMGALEDRGFAMRGFLDGPALLEELDSPAGADALLLDWTLPGMSGLDVLSRVRDRGIDVPVAFLTGRALIDYEHLALNRGAIDFIDKTRGADVIAHRLTIIVEAHRRRLSTVREPERPLTVGSLALWHRNRRADWHGQDVGLTLTEYNIVRRLASEAGQPVTYRAIYDTMHYPGFLAGCGEDGYLVNVRSSVKRIRKKFLALDPTFAEIENRAAIGYLWRTLVDGS
jgi:two-component system response regulator ChvI